MTDYSSFANILRPLPFLTANQTTAESAASTSSPAATTGQGMDSGQFQQLLTTLLLGLSLQSMMGGTDSSASSMASMSGLGSNTLGSSLGQTSDIGNMMAPFMVQLLEQLLAQDVRSGQATTQANVIQPTRVDPPVAESDISSQPTGKDKPQGSPLKGVLTQGSRSGHVALDFGVPVGTQVKTTMDGKVVYAGWNNEGYGNLVIVENGPYRTYYAHLSKIPVEVGQFVAAGSTVGLSGNTGNSTGPHLHYEVRKNGQQLNPSSFL